MKHVAPIIVLATLAAPTLADETRQLDAHVHGAGELDIAIDGTTLVMELHVPGADIVGFEYVPQSEEDKATVAAAIETLSAPLTQFSLSETAGCVVTAAAVDLMTDAEEAHGHDEHAHEEHAEKDHDHGEHAHDDHAHDDHAHDDHADETAATHSEFHGEYALTCVDPTALDQIAFPYFDSFPNAQSLDIRIVGPTGAQAFEVTRDAPVLTLNGLF